MCNIIFYSLFSARLSLGAMPLVFGSPNTEAASSSSKWWSCRGGRGANSANTHFLGELNGAIVLCAGSSETWKHMHGIDGCQQKGCGRNVGENKEGNLILKDSLQVQSL